MSGYIHDYDFHGGLLLRATSPRKPWFRCEYARPGEDYALQIVAGDVARLTFAIDDWWSSLTMVRMRSDRCEVVPPIRADVARRAEWLKHFAEALLASERSPLHSGSFWIVPASKRRRPSAPHLPPLFDLRLTFERGRKIWEPHHFGAVWPLRDPSPPNAGRVKLWRKHAKNGTLPPLLLLSVTPLESYVLLDGHDRLLAALLEKKEPAALVLAPLRQGGAPVPAWQAHLEHQLSVAQTERFSPKTIEGFNRQLIAAYGGETYEVRTRCWPLRAARAKLKVALS